MLYTPIPIQLLTKDNPPTQSTTLCFLSTIDIPYKSFLSIPITFASAYHQPQITILEILLGIKNSFYAYEKNYIGTEQLFDGIKKNIIGIKYLFYAYEKNYIGIEQLFDGTKKNFIGIKNLFCAYRKNKIGISEGFCPIK